MPTPPSDSSWSDTEKFIWDCATRGDFADLNERDGFTCDVGSAEGWPDSRTVSPSFLETILTDEERKRAIHPRGLRMVGVRFVEKVDLSNLTIPFPFVVSASRFENECCACELIVEGSLSFQGTRFSSLLNLHRSLIQRSLILREITAEKGLDLQNARIHGQLDLRNASVAVRLTLESLAVADALIAHSLSVHGSLVAHNARCGNGLDLSNSRFSPADTIAHSRVDLTGATIQNELCLWQPEADPITWDRTALILRNVSCGSLQDHPDGWPEVLDLTGFTYERLGGLGGGTNGSIAHRSKEWLLGWLDRQADGDTLLAYRDYAPLPSVVSPRARFSPQSYEQLASVLEKEGMRDLARVVHIEKMERFRSVATGWDRVWLTFIKYLINYGYSSWRPLAWALLLLFLGANVALRYSIDHNFPHDPLAFSLDMLLPVVRLYAPHYSFKFVGWYYQWWFYFEQIMGHALALFVGAGLAGLTKR